MTSWWVDKDRDAFNVALKDHTQRVMRREPPAVAAPTPPVVVAPEPPPSVVVEEPRRPAVTENARRWNAANIRKGLCARCGRPRTNYPQHCNRCQAKYTGRVQRRQGYHAWRPGSRGRLPKAVKPFVQMANIARKAILDCEDYQSDPALQRAAIVMFCGFFLGQDPTWIVPWSGYAPAEVARIRRHLRRAGVWCAKRTLACHWMDTFSARHISKRALREADFNFWLDALVANGDIDRETRNGEFFYSANRITRKLAGSLD